MLRHHNYIADGDPDAREQLSGHHQQWRTAHLVHSPSARAWVAAQIYRRLQNFAGFHDGADCHPYSGIAGQQSAPQHWVSHKVAVDSTEELSWMLCDLFVMISSLLSFTSVWSPVLFCGTSIGVTRRKTQKLSAVDTTVQFLNRKSKHS